MMSWLSRGNFLIEAARAILEITAAEQLRVCCCRSASKSKRFPFFPWNLLIGRPEKENILKTFMWGLIHLGARCSVLHQKYQQYQYFN
jgi:hypothetical protein